MYLNSDARDVYKGRKYFYFVINMVFQKVEFIRCSEQRLNSVTPYKECKITFSRSNQV